MSKTISNFKNIERKDLLFMKNQKSRILQREEKIKYLESLFKYSPIEINDNIKAPKNIKKSFLNKSYKNKNLHLILPSIKTIQNNTMNSYERMKNYKVLFHKNKNNASKNKVKKFLMKSGFSYNLTENNAIKETKENKDNKKNSEQKGNRLDELKNDIKRKFIEDSPNTQRSKLDKDNNINQPPKYKKINFEDYLKMQTKAESILKPKLGDHSTDLIEYIKAIKGIRENIIENIIQEINNAENRFNNEMPNVDSNFNVIDKSIYIHKWKNLFFIRDYQRFFMKGLKGRISNSNFYLMQKKFVEINNICFAPPKGQQIRDIEMPK